MSKQDGTAGAPHSPSGPDADSRCRDEEGISAEQDHTTVSGMDHAASMGNATNRTVFGREEGRAMLDGQAVSPATDQRRFYSIAVPWREDHCPTIRTFGLHGTAESENDHELETKACSSEPSPLPVPDEQEGQEIEAMNKMPRAEAARTLVPQQQMGVVHENISTKKQPSLGPGYRSAQSTSKVTYDPSDAPFIRKPEFAETSGQDDDTPLNPEENQLDKKNKVPTFLGEVEKQRDSNADEHENLTAQNDVENPVPVDTERPGASHEDTNPRAINANDMQSPFVRVADGDSDVNLRDIKATISEFLSQHVTAFIGRESPIIVELGSHDEDGESMELVYPPTQAYENIDGQNDSNDDSTNLPVSVDVLDIPQSMEENAGFASDVEDAIPGAGHSATFSNELDDQSSEENLEDGGEDAIPGPEVIEHSETSANEIELRTPEGNTEYDEDSADAVPGIEPSNEIDDESPEEDAEHADGGADVIPGFYETQAYENIDGQNDSNDDSTNLPVSVDVLDIPQSMEENAGFASDVEDAIPGAGHSATFSNELDDQSSEENLEDGGEDAIPGPEVIEHSETSANGIELRTPEGNTEYDEDSADAVPGIEPSNEIDDESPEEDAEHADGGADVIPGFYEVTLVDILRYFNDRQRTSIPPGIRGIMRRILLSNPQEKENYQITLVDICRYFNDRQRTSIPPGIREIMRRILIFTPQEKDKDQILVPICQKDMEKRITNPTDDCNAFHFPIPGKEVPNQLNGSKNNNTANHVPIGQIFELRRNIQPIQLPAHVFPAQLNVQQHQIENGNPGPEVINRQNSAGMGPGNNRIEINPEMPLELCLRCGAALGYAEHECPADAMQDEVHAFVMENRPAENPEDGHAFNDEPYP